MTHRLPGCSSQAPQLWFGAPTSAPGEQVFLRDPRGDALVRTVPGEGLAQKAAYGNALSLAKKGEESILFLIKNIILALEVIVYTVRDFPGGPVAKTLSSQCRGPGFDP